MGATKQTRIALAGVGMIGRAHQAVLTRSNTTVLAAIVDPSPAAQAIAAAAGVPLFKTLQALFDADRPDGIVLATPNHLHVEHALTAIKAGVPALLEKPIAPTVREAEALVEAVERHRATLLIGHHRAHSAIMAAAKRVIDGGQIGRVVSVMGSAVFFKPDAYFAEAPWRSAIGGGPILLNMIHEVHNLRMLCGEIVAVQAFTSNAVRGHAVEDTVAINLRFASGALGSFMLSDTAACPRSWEQTSQENKSYTTYPDEDCYVIAGTMGALSVPTMRLKTYSHAADRSWWKPFDQQIVTMTRDDPLEKQMAHFVDVIVGKATPVVSALDGLRNVQITEAIVAAAQQGSTIETT